MSFSAAGGGAAPVSITLDPIDAEFLADTQAQEESQDQSDHHSCSPAGFAFVASSVWPEVKACIGAHTGAEVWCSFSLQVA